MAKATRMRCRCAANPDKAQMLTAITRKISPSIAQCELTHLERVPIDLEKAQEQHQQYEKVLESMGIRVLSLPVEVNLPDSVFVEDAAVVLEETALITRPGAKSRRAETESIANALAAFRKLEWIQPPGTLDGGDVLVIDKTVYIGISSRSNENALQQMQKILCPHGYEVKGVKVAGCLHLKSAVTRIAENILLLNPAWVDKNCFPGMQMLEIDPDEPAAANGLLTGSKVIYANSYPKTLTLMRKMGIEVITLDVSEIAKAEGAVTCCSLIFRTL
jgi:dimethylargininase